MIVTFLLFLSGCSNLAAFTGAVVGGVAAGPYGLLGGAVVGDITGKLLVGKPLFDSPQPQRLKQTITVEPSPMIEPIIEPVEPEPAKKDDSAEIKELKEVF